jgi:hypothetical protein
MGVVVDYQNQLSGEIEKVEPLNREHGERQQRGLKQSRNRVDCIS